MVQRGWDIGILKKGSLQSSAGFVQGKSTFLVDDEIIRDFNDFPLPSTTRGYDPFSAINLTNNRPVEKNLRVFGHIPYYQAPIFKIEPGTDENQ